MTPEEVQEMFGDADPFSDFFHTFFGGAPAGGSARGRAARPRRGRDVEHGVDLTLEEALSGANRRLTINQDGRSRTVDVRIPAGVRDGSKVRAAGEGEPAPPGGSAGDLFLVVRILPHPRFERRGQDLHTKVRIPVVTAVLGGEVSVDTLNGSSLRLRVPELTGSGRLFRLRGHGMPRVGKPDDRGDMFVAAEIAVPTELSADEREHYEALRKLERASETNGSRP
jgi:DnaJ-class molecular chaperone